MTEYVAGALHFTESITGSIRRHDTIPWWKMGRGAGGSVSCVSDVYSNTAQAGLHTAGSSRKHEWSPVVDRTHPAGGNLICNILSNSERLRGGREPRGDKLLRVTRRLTDQKKQKKKIWQRNQVWFLSPSSGVCFFFVDVLVNVGWLLHHFGPSWNISTMR